MYLKLTVRTTLSAIALFTVAACGGSGQSSDNGSGNSNGSISTVNTALPKTIDVFGIPIRATAEVDDSLMVHAAAAMAEYRDNDEDGNPDNQQIVDALNAAGATLVIASNSAQLDRVASQVYADENWQDLLADEVFPNGRASGQFDATYEEVLHLITHTGYARVYPEGFAEQPACLIIEGESALMFGVIGPAIGSAINTLLTDHSDVRTILMMDVPGSMDDESNLQAGRTLNYYSDINLPDPSGFYFRLC